MSSQKITIRKSKKGVAAPAPAPAPEPINIAHSPFHREEWTEQPFKIIESYFEGQHLDRLVRHQIESYNHFCNFQLQRTIQMFNPIVSHSENDFNPETGKYDFEVMINLENFKLYPPQIHENNGATKLMFPHEARLRNFTYASNMTVDVNIKYTIREKGDETAVKHVSKTLSKINIGKLPIMLKSSICLLTQNKNMDYTQTGECKYDCGGYFIINGTEKTVLAQERAAENRVYCYCGKNTTKWSWYAEIKSVPDFKCISPKQFEVLIANKNNGFGHGIFVNIPRIKTPIELFVIFRALGVISDKSICEYILLNIENERQKVLLDALYASIMDANKYMTQEEALQHITSHVAYVPMNMDKDMGAIKKREFAMEVLANDLFPHCQTTSQKIYFLGYMTNVLLQTSLGWIAPDDRDSYVNKRIELTGTLINNLFRNYLNKLVKEMQKQIIREINNSTHRDTGDYENIINHVNIHKIIKSTTIENGIRRALSTGDFSLKTSNTSKVGVAQVLNRLTYAASLSHLRRVNTPMDKSGELIAPRKLHNTTWGFLCVTESPEGQSIGLVKNLSYMSHVTIPSNSTPLYEYVEPYLEKVDNLTPRELYGLTKVFVNGAWIGITRQPMELYNDMKNKKTRGIVNIYTSVVFNYKFMEIRICNDGGRLARPVLRVRDNQLLVRDETIERIERGELMWNDLLCSGGKLEDSILEYIDPEEQNWSMVAMKPSELVVEIDYKDQVRKKYTHCEIHPSTVFGVLASCIPFPEYNQAPRNAYQSCMSKQSIGIYSTNYDQRMDKSSYILSYPTRPLVDTRIMDFIKLNEIPSGTQAIVAIMTHTGYNQEDSILINKGSIERGMFMATIYHTEKDENKKINGDEQIRCKPDPTKTKGMKFGNYEKVNNQGFIPENTLVENRDIIISKVLPIKENRNDPAKTMKYEDQSKAFKTTEQTYIDKNYMGRNGDGYNFAKVRTRTLRKPVIGDKFASRSAQKGTVGNIVPEEDMPFTKSGLRPDIIINPHCFVGESLVSLPHGLSRRIDSFSSQGLEKVFSFTDSGILRSESLGLDNKGIRQTIKLTFIDGREIICTPDHKIRIIGSGEQHEWKEAQYLRPEDKILMGPRGTEDMSYDDEHNWNLQMGEFTFNMKTSLERHRALAFARILGYMLTDGTLCKTLIKGCNCYKSNVNMGCMFDAENMLDDIQFVTGKRPTIQNCHSDKNGSDVFVISIPSILSKAMATLENITIGRRTSQLADYPKFLETAPRAFVREFLAATFGGDGWAPHYASGTKKTFTRVKFSQSVNAEFVDSLIEKTKLLIDFMGKVGVDANIVRSRFYKENTKVSVELEVNSNAQFLKYIGFRHCVQKLLRLEVAASYENYCQKVLRQNENITCSVNEFIEAGCSIETSILKAREQLYNRGENSYNISLNKYYSELTRTAVVNRRKQSRSTSCKVFDYKYMTTAHEYLKMCGVENWFDKGTYIVGRDDTLLPFYTSSLMKIEEHAEREVFDIGVSVTHSFMVSGVCVSNCVPSRMTLAQLKETLLCKVLMELGMFGDGTAFGDLDIKEHITKMVQDAGFEAYGNEVMYNGLTGEQMETNIFIGPCFYQRLKHMVNDKVHSRATGPMVILNRQPTEGRSKGGGLRLGEMEQNCLTSGGYSAFLRERFYDASDKFSTHVCNKCGLIAAYNDKYNIHLCRTCDNKSDFSYVEVPYAFKLMSQELQTINVSMRLITE